MSTTIQQARSGTSRPASPPTPMNGETQVAFYLRAMRALRQIIPSINRRTLEVLRIWSNSDNGRDLREKAEAQFPSDSYQHFEPRCLFVEHVVPANDQQPELRYGREALRQMVDWANYRIRNSDTFSVLSDGHTPTAAELAVGRPMPDVLGYVGPFYLGQLGDVNPQWAIYADEWIHRADLSRREKRQRRSPEVWVSEPIERRTMDPIAALGAETPRLDCGMNPYSRAGDGQTVMSYSAMTFGTTLAAIGQPAAKSSSGSDSANAPHPNDAQTASGSFRSPVSDAGSGTYSSLGEFIMPLSNSVPNQGQAAVSGIDPRTLEQTVLRTVSALLPSIVQTVQRQLLVDIDDAFREDDPTIDSEANGAGADSDTPLAAEASELSLGGETSDLPDDVACVRYSALSDECQRAYRAGWRQGKLQSQRYSRHSDLHQVVARQQVRLQELSEQIARERRDATRYSKLTELSREFAFDPREEAETCRELTDKQFERHCTATIVKYARRDDVTNVELFTDPTVCVDRYGAGAATRANIDQIERYSREAAAIAARKNASQRGSTTFAVEFDAICKQHGINV